MCGRYITGEMSWSQVHELLGLPLRLEVTPRARYNVAPQTPVPVLRPAEATGGTPGEVRVAHLRWGVKPDWAKSLLINAQAEKYGAAGQTRSYWKGGWSRCVFPAWGYYEWAKVKGQTKKQPMLLRASDDRPLAFAGLWRPWEDELEAAAVILTTAPADDIAAIHHRMPAILPWPEVARWLDPALAREQAAALLQPREGLVAYPVSSRVGRVTVDDPDLIRPIE